MLSVLSVLDENSSGPAYLSLHMIGSVYTSISKIDEKCKEQLSQILPKTKSILPYFALELGD